MPKFTTTTTTDGSLEVKIAAIHAIGQIVSAIIANDRYHVGGGPAGDQRDLGQIVHETVVVFRGNGLLPTE